MKFLELTEEDKKHLAERGNNAAIGSDVFFIDGKYTTTRPRDENNAPIDTGHVQLNMYPFEGNTLVTMMVGGEIHEEPYKIEGEVEPIVVRQNFRDNVLPPEEPEAPTV